MSCDVCQKAGPDIAGKTKFVTGKKKFNREILVYHNTRGFSALEPEPSLVFWLDTSVDVASGRPASQSVDSTGLFLGGKNGRMLCFYTSW
jgi:hypothetical protein